MRRIIAGEAEPSPLDTDRVLRPSQARFFRRSPGTRISDECASITWPGIIEILQAQVNGRRRVRIALLIDPVFKQHDTGPGHPERPERYDALTRAFDRAGLTKSLLHVATRPATEDEIALVHTRPYIQTVKRDIAAGATRAEHRRYHHQPEVVGSRSGRRRRRDERYRPGF